jgi:hypothetical protein
LPPNTTLQSFQNQLEGKLKAPQPGGFAVTGIGSVVCNMPHVWAAGNMFTCYVYDNNSNELGTVAGTVTTTQPGNVFNDDVTWKPASNSNSNNSNTNTNTG